MLVACYRHAVANIQVKGVPNALHRRLRAVAARRGQAMREVVLEALRRELSHEEFLARLRRRERTSLGRPAGELVHEVRAERELEL